MTRAEHMAWAKGRALELVVQGDVDQGFTSFMSDLCKHPETEKSIDVLVELGGPLLVGGHLDRADQMKSFIEGFN